jgi:hypothetical protein
VGNPTVIISQAAKQLMEDLEAYSNPTDPEALGEWSILVVGYDVTAKGYMRIKLLTCRDVL